MAEVDERIARLETRTDEQERRLASIETKLDKLLEMAAMGKDQFFYCSKSLHLLLLLLLP